MKDNMLKDEELKNAVGGANTSYEEKGLRECIDANAVAGAQYYTIELMRAGKASAVKAILDSYTEPYNDAWNTASTFYLGMS